MSIKAFLVRNRKSIGNALLQGAFVASGLMVMRLAGLLVSIVVARIAGADTLGEFTFFLTLFVMTSEILYSFDLAYIREAGTAKDMAHRQQYLRWSMLAKLAVVIAVSLLMVGVTDTLSSFFEKENAGSILQWAVIAGSLNGLFMFMVASFQQRRRFSIVGILQPLPNVLILIGVFIVAALGLLQSIGNIMPVYAGVCFLLGLVGCAFVLIKVGSIDAEAILSPSVRKAYFLMIGALLLAKGLSLVSMRLDVFFLGKWLSYEELGLYGVALRTSILVSLVTVVTGALILPRAAEAMTDAIRFRRYLGLAGLFVSLQTVVAVILLIFIKPIIGFIFGADFEAAAWITRVLLIQTLFTAYGSPFQALMQCGMPPVMNVVIAGTRMLISLPLLWYSVPRYGLEGAAVSVALITLIISTIQFSVVWSRRPRASLE